MLWSWMFFRTTKGTQQYFTLEEWATDSLSQNISLVEIVCFLNKFLNVSCLVCKSRFCCLIGYKFPISRPIIIITANKMNFSNRRNLKRPTINANPNGNSRILEVVSHRKDRKINWKEELINVRHLEAGASNQWTHFSWWWLWIRKPKCGVTDKSIKVYKFYIYHCVLSWCT